VHPRHRKDGQAEGAVDGDEAVPARPGGSAG
jgi:hypothetical protein